MPPHPRLSSYPIAYSSIKSTPHAPLIDIRLEVAHFIIAFFSLEMAVTQQPPNYAPAFILGNWLYAYCTLSPRFAKMAVGLDHNLSPREDLAKYGAAAVQAGKLSRQRLGQIRRMQSAHENSVEGFTLFVACGMSFCGSSGCEMFGSLTWSSVSFATYASISSTTINTLCAWYTLSRLLYGAAYILIESERLSLLRTLIWWSCNASCITGIVLAARVL